MPASTLLSQSQQKYFKSLLQKKYRTLNKAFIIEGEKMVREIFHNQNSQISVIRVLALDEFFRENPEFLSRYNCLVVSKRDIEKISTLSNPDRVLMEMKLPDYSIGMEWKEELNLYFESIRDPGNLGTIIRTADWFGFNKVFCSPDSVDAYNPKVIQSTMGSISRVKVIYTEAEDFLNWAAQELEFQNVGTVLGGESIYEKGFPMKGMIYFGNESNGLSSSIINACQQHIGIPGSSTDNGPESLNLGISAGIVLSEISRQNLLKMKV